MTMFPKYEDWLNEDLGKGKPSPIVNDDLEDIRLFKGSVAQLNDWLNKKLEDQNKTWNPYADMQYKHPVERTEKDDSIGYQDYKHGKDTYPENAKATRRRGSKVDPAKFASSLDEATWASKWYDQYDKFRTVMKDIAKIMKKHTTHEKPFQKAWDDFLSGPATHLVAERNKSNSQTGSANDSILGYRQCLRAS